MRKRDDDLLDLGRLSEPALLILVSLADGPKHGYAMTVDIEEMTGKRPGPGTLYGAITRLEEQSLIERLDSEDRRNPYRLTGRGLKLLRAHLAAMERVARVGLRRLAAAQ
jgi:DNA-binding PadR family transcriptional regulator